MAQALVILDTVHESCPVDYGTARDLALAEITTGDFSKAKALISVLLQQQDRPELHSLLGRIATAEHNDKEAALQYQAAATVDPNEDNVFAFGTSLFRLNENAAVEILRYGVQKFPRSVKLKVALATALYAQGSTEEGAGLLCDAAELAPSDPHPMEILADTELVPADAQPRAVRLLAALHHEYPQDGLILFDYIMVESRRWSGETGPMPVGFLASIKAALSLTPKMPQAYSEVALAYDLKQRYSQEVEALRHAVALDPLNAKYHYRLAFAYRKLGNQPGFQQELRQYQLHQAPSTH